MKRTARQTEATAYHEAGHAAVGYFLRQRINRVELVTDEDECHGHITFSRTRGDDLLDDDLRDGHTFAIDAAHDGFGRLHRLVMTEFAGPLAQQMYAGRYDHVGASGDVSGLLGRCAKVIGDKDELATMLAWLEMRTLRLLSRPEQWGQVRRIARDLLRTNAVSGRRVRELAVFAGVKEDAEELAAAERHLNEIAARKKKKG